MTEPSAETPRALLLRLPPGSVPRPTIPVSWVHRNACVPDPELLPTMTEPSAETPSATLLESPGRTPSWINPVSARKRNASS